MDSLLFVTWLARGLNAALYEPSKAATGRRDGTLYSSMYLFSFSWTGVGAAQLTYHVFRIANGVVKGRGRSRQVTGRDPLTRPGDSEPRGLLLPWSFQSNLLPMPEYPTSVLASYL